MRGLLLFKEREWLDAVPISGAIYLNPACLPRRGKAFLLLLKPYIL